MAKRTRGELCGSVPYGWNAMSNGRRHPKSGKDIKVLVANSTEQAGLRQMLLLRAKGYGFGKIANQLQKMGIPTKTPAGTMINSAQGRHPSSGRWNGGSVASIIRNTYTRELIDQLASQGFFDDVNGKLSVAPQSLVTMKARPGRPAGRSWIPPIRTRRESKPNIPQTFTEQIRRYEQYLKSDHWLELRKRKLMSVGFQCEDCGAETDDIQVHHSRYGNLVDVELPDLVALCRKCHSRRHGIDMPPTPPRKVEERPIQLDLGV